MWHSIFARTLRDQRRSLPWWAAGLAGTCVLMMSFYPSIRQNAAELARFLKNMPPQLMAAFAGASDFVSPEGYANGRLFFFLLPTVFAVYAIASGARAVAGEEEHGTLELVLSTPVLRRRIVLEKFTAIAASCGLLAVVTWGSLAASEAVGNYGLSLGRLAEACLSLWLLSTTLAAAALAVGAARGHHGPAAGVVAAAAVAMYLVNSLSPVAEGLRSWRTLSWFYYFIANDPLKNGLSLRHAAALAASTAILVAISIATFDRRDIAT